MDLIKHHQDGLIKNCIEFTKYAAYIAWKMGDLVDMWSTMCEPNIVASSGYVTIKSGFPPGYLSFDSYTNAIKNFIEAHARAYDAIKEKTNTPVGIIYSITYPEPLSDNDKDATEFFKKTLTLDFIDSIKFGNSSFFIDRTDLKNKIDWLGINYYTRIVITKSETPPGFKLVEGYGTLCQPKGYSKAGRPCSDFGWEIYPEGLQKSLTELYSRYKVPLIITENGIADENDTHRPKYLLSHLLYTYKALKEGADIKGYLHWALIDNYEWASGYKMKFGLYSYNKKTKKRTARPSALVFKLIAEQKSIPEEMIETSENDV